METFKQAKKYLKDFLKIAPLSHALWRSVEALAYNEVKFSSPVLDLGCGFGEFAGVVFNRIEMGIDINETELKAALRGKNYKKVRLADARNLPFNNSSYNTVVSVSVIEHITDSSKVIAEVYRVLKKKGLFVFSVPTLELNKHLLLPKILKAFGFPKAAKEYIDLHAKVFKHVNLKNKNWWTRELKKAKFEIVDIHGTLSPTLLKLHEIFLISAFPSQLGKWLSGKRLMMSIGARSRLLPIFFSRFVKIDRNSNINLFIVARKR